MNTEILRVIANDLLNPEILPDFPFQMAGRACCVFGFMDEFTYPTIEDIILNGNEEQNYPAIWWIGATQWYYFDNTREGAAKRILYLIDNGVPEGFEKECAGQCDFSRFLSLYQ